MKKSTIALFVLVMYIIEIVIGADYLNELYKWYPYAIQTKYFILCIVVYGIWTIFSSFYIFNTGDSKREEEEHFLNTYGTEKFNVLYTWHFFVFGAVAFHTSAWQWVMMAALLAGIWGWIRRAQNEFVSSNELQALKDAAKNKKTAIVELRD